VSAAVSGGGLADNATYHFNIWDDPLHTILSDLVTVTFTYHPINATSGYSTIAVSAQSGPGLSHFIGGINVTETENHAQQLTFSGAGANYWNGANATTGLRFGFESVPEPLSCLLLVAMLGGVAGARKLKLV